MSGSLGELTVRFTGDASQLAATISEVQGQLSGLQKKSGGATAATEGFIKNTKRGSDILSQYKAQMTAAGKAVDEHKTALAKAKTAVETNNSALTAAKQKYEATKKSVFDNCAALKQEEKQLSVLSQAKKNEISALEKSNASINNNSLAYKDNEKAINWTKNELSSIEKQQLKVQNALNSQGQVLRSSIVDYNNAGAAVRNANKGYEQAETALKNAQNTYREYQDGLAAVEKQQRALNLQTTGNSMQEAGKSINTITKPLQIASAALAAGGVASAKFAIDFEDNFANVKKTVEGTPEQLAAVKQGIIDLSTKGIEGRNALPQTTAQLTELAAAGGQLGIQTENIIEFTETMAQMGTATNLYGAEGAATLARFMNVTNTSQDQVKNLGSAIVDLGNNFATTESEIATLALRMGATGNVVGISAQDVLGYSTALSSMGIEAEAGGSAVSRIWMNIQSAVSSGGEDLAAFAKVSGKSSEEFARQWKTDASGAFQTFLTGLSKSEDQVATLGELGFNNIRDIQALQRLASEKGIQLVTDALRRANSAWAENVALQKEADAKAETTAGQLQITKNNLVEAGRSIGEAFLPMIKDASVGVAEFAQGIADMDEGSKRSLVNVATGIIGLGAGAKVVSGTVKGIGSFVEALGKLGMSEGAVAAIGPAMIGVAGGVAAMTGAVVLGTKAYKAYKEAQLDVVKVTDDQIKANKESLSNFDKIQEYKALSQQYEAIIKTSADTAEIEDAKKKLDELKQKVEDDYKVKITVDNDGVPDFDDLGDDAKSDLLYNRAELQKQLNTSDFSGAAEGVKEFSDKLNNAQSDLKRYTAAQAEYTNLSANFEAAQKDLNNQFDNGAISADEYSQKLDVLSSDLSKAQSDVQNKYGVSPNDPVSGWIIDAENAAQDYQSVLDRFNGEVEQYKEAIKGIADDNNALIPEQIKNGQYAQAMRDISTELGNVKNYTQEMGFDDFARGIVEQTSVAQQGLENIYQVAQGSREGIQGFFNDFAVNAQTAGAGADELATAVANIGTSLIQNGADASVVQEIVSGIEGLPENKTIKINAEGDGLEVLEEEPEPITQQVNYEQGEVPKNVPPAEGKANFTLGEHPTEAPSIPGTANFVMGEHPTEAPSIPGTANYTGKFPDSAPTIHGTVVYDITYHGGLPLPGKAKGTSDFEGGFAMINDQRGVRDPRELVQIGNKGYIFEGKDVVLPLPRHAKVFTAAQTHNMMTAAGIPHYASGKNNEAWENAKSDREHIRATTYGIIPAWEELKWLEDMKKEFASDAEVIKEIEEEVVKYTREMWQENLDSMQYALDMGWTSEEEYYSNLASYRDENFAPDTQEYRDATLELHKYSVQLIKDAQEASKAYIDLHGSLNDWGEMGTSMGAVWQTVNQRNVQAAKDGLITWDEYFENREELTEQFLDNYKDYSDDWIKHEQDYNNLSAEGTIEAINRQRGEVERYFAEIGELTDEEYLLKIKLETELDDKALDAAWDAVEEWRSDADWYKKQAEVYGWNFLHPDSETEYWQRVIKNYTDAANSGKLSETDRYKALREADEARLELYKATEDTYDDMLDATKDRMDELKEALDDRLEALETSWEVEDRAEDKSETIADINKFRNAVTLEGREKYQEALDKLKEIERDEMRFELEQENNAIMEQMQAEYDALEEKKADALEQLKAANMRVASLVQPLDSSINSMETSLSNKMDALINVLQTQIEKLKPDVTVNQEINSVITDGTDGQILANSVFNKILAGIGG